MEMAQKSFNEEPKMIGKVHFQRALRYSGGNFFIKHNQHVQFLYHLETSKEALVDEATVIYICNDIESLGNNPTTNEELYKISKQEHLNIIDALP